ncbi:UDP-N-acetylmuramate--L-alanine ligase-like isoform X2 [Macadamia integrifolia]|uniref:UDP-N-acetylmuramate--L-alanine ligase-like isoform X2 n=1 Tax=Macadamia integrifolia TaxID=60698 RepID=UPI001C4F448D|nr:UDP-N-acetylmuramate--L-alanine ligase-like isoform X2 [Macadamia integrifolia]
MEIPALSASNNFVHVPVKSTQKLPSGALNLYYLLNFRRRGGTERFNSYATTQGENRVSVSANHSPNRTQPMSNDSNPKNQNGKGWVHFVGIGGCGLSALAMLALKQGMEVSGSDILWSSFTDGLQEAGARLYLGHSESNIHRKDGTGLPNAIVVSSAIPPDNVEILYKRDYWLGKVTEHHDLIAVSGTHGKSTTASMLAYVLSAMGEDLTAIVGADVPQFQGGNMIAGCGQNFVLEADEYDGCFLGLSPYIAVITNVEWEHVDIFQDEEAVVNTFRRFLKKIRLGGHLILCGDSECAYSLLRNTRQGFLSDQALWMQSSQLTHVGYRLSTYGISDFNEWHASSICPNSQGGSDYVLYHRGCPVGDISLQLPGVHNVLNSLAVIATIKALVSDQKLTEDALNCLGLHLNNFMGVSRRFQIIGKINGCQIYDDYAHHPTEVHAVLQAARQKFPSMALWVIFQPHTFSRLAAFMKDFASAFSDADRVVITEIYAAREINTWNVTGADLASSIIKPSAKYIPSLEDVVEKLALEIFINPNREVVVLTLGAGDVTTIGPRILQVLQEKSVDTSQPNS